LNLSIVTPEGQKVATEVTELTVPGALGEIGVLPGHVPIFTVLQVGALSYVGTEGKKTLAIAGGFLQVNDDTLSVLTETAEHSHEISVERATEAKTGATQELATMEAGSDTYQSRLKALQRAENRLAVAKSN
jgi:F-type H+-transporting ATPase subunit epsilon